MSERIPSRPPVTAPRARLAAAIRRAAVATLLSSLTALAACAEAPSGIVLDVYKYREQTFERVVERCNAEADGRYTIVLHVLPRDANGQREQLVRRLAARDDAMDILGLDVTWTAEFAEAGWILEWTGDDLRAAREGVLPGPLATTTWEGRTYAATANTNVQLLWYRTDLVPEPPATWDEMIAVAEDLRAAGEPHVIAFTGAQYEGLVVGFNTLLASYGGRLVSEDGATAVVDERTVRALEMLRRFATSAGASAALSNAREAEAQAQMESGFAAFELNWPYVWAAMRQNNPEMAEHFAFARYPSVVPGQPARVTPGGLNYAVSAYSRYPDEAREAILCLRDAESQEFLALNAGTPPSIESLYGDPELREAYPMLDVIRDELENAVPRPKTPFYQNISTIVAAALSPPAEIEPREVAEELRRQVQAALESRGVLP